jgi:hypothetical protein
MVMGTINGGGLESNARPQNLLNEISRYKTSVLRKCASTLCCDMWNGDISSNSNGCNKTWPLCPSST